MKYFSELLNKYIVISIILTSFFSSCETDAGLVDCFPRSDINVKINTQLPLYQDIKTPGGWIYLDEQFSGTKGLIIYRQNNTLFRAYDRNSPHICPSETSTLTVSDNSIEIISEDGGVWLLSSGEPFSGSTKGIPLKSYSTFYNPSDKTLQIFN